MLNILLHMNCSFQALKTKLSWSFSLGIMFYIHTNGQKHVPCLTRNNSHYIIYARTPVSENLYSRIFIQCRLFGMRLKCMFRRTNLWYFSSNQIPSFGFPEADLGLLQYPRRLPAVNVYHKALHLGCWSSPRSASNFTISLEEIINENLSTHCTKNNILHKWFLH